MKIKSDVKIAKCRSFIYFEIFFLISGRPPIFGDTLFYSSRHTINYGKFVAIPASRKFPTRLYFLGDQGVAIKLIPQVLRSGD